MKSLTTELISNEEKNRILELHNKVKNYEFSKKISKILREQTTVTNENDPEQKRFLINARTLCPDLGGPGVKLELHRLEDTEKFFLYKKDKDGLEYYYKPNGTVDIVSKKDGKASIVRKSTWYCQALVNQERNKKQEIPNQERQNFIEAGWTPIEDLRASGKTESEIKTTYRKHPNYELYMYVGDPNRIKGYSNEQQAFINAWTSNPDVSDNIERQVYKINPTAADFATGDWKLDAFFRAPNSEKFFEDGLKVYFNLSKKPEPTRSNCKSMIKDFADKYKRRDSNPQTVQYINYTRGFIQDCVNKYKFGGALSGLNDELNLLGGITTGGAGRRSPWHIQLPE